MNKVTNLQVNHLAKPVGIRGSHLTLTWTLEGCVAQSAYEVSVADAAGSIIFTSGRTKSSDMRYPLPKALRPRRDYEIRVRVWDENGLPSEPCSVAVTTGIGKRGWQAKWISPENPKAKMKRGERRPGGYLRKTFAADHFRAAKLYLTAHGIVNVWLNGEEVTDHQLMPGTSQYNRRLMMETIDVTDHLREGENVLLFSLGDGWYRGSMGFTRSLNVFGRDISLLAQLEVDGEPAVVTDESWEASCDGPLGINDMLSGEVYDARRRDTMTWHAAYLMKFGYDNLCSVDTVPILPHETFAAKKIDTPDGSYVLDFGQNLVGYVQMDFTAHAGDHIRLDHGEVLGADGSFTLSNLVAGKKPQEQFVDYTCCEGRNAYRPTKTYFGFRYVKVDADFDVDPSAFTAVAIYSDMPQTGRFECGVPEVNQLFHNALWSMKGNFVDVPTDCPTREKSGYSGDAQVFSQTAMYLMDCYPVYAKWIREQAATQFPDGNVAQVAPDPFSRKIPADGGVGWSDSLEIVPEALAARYGDAALAEEVYDQIKAFLGYRLARRKKIRFANRRLVPRELRPYTMDSEWMWGEWLEPDRTDSAKDRFLKGDIEVSTAYLACSCGTAAALADRLGRTEDAVKYREIAAKAKDAYHKLFLPDGRITEPKRQCRYVRPIALDILTEEEKQQAADQLADLITANGNHLNTGFLTTYALCGVLTDYGHADKAYDLLLQEDAPGWLYAVKHGATTIPERWNCYDEAGTPSGSFNHYSYGSIAGWLFSGACGIRVRDGRITVEPHPDERLGYARAEYDSPLGKIVSAWKYEDGAVKYHIEIPANTRAQIRVSDTVREVGAGVWDM